HGVRGGECHVVGVAPDGADGDVSLAEVVGDSSGSEPGGDGAASFGEEDAKEQKGYARGGAFVEPVSQVGEGGGQEGWRVRQWGHGRSLDSMEGVVTSSCPGSRPSSTPPASFHGLRFLQHYRS